MGKLMRRIILGILAAAGVAALIVSLLKWEVPMTQFISIANGENGESIVAWYDGDQTVVGQVNNQGNITGYLNFATQNEGELYSIRGMSAGSEDMVYVLRDVKNAYTGELVNQELVIADFAKTVPEISKIFMLTDEDENYEYGWIRVNGETISLIGTDRYESEAIRRTYEYGSLLSGALNIKSTRNYMIEEGEGIYQAIGNSTDLVYISDSGKIFRASETHVTEIYPARVVESLMYPTFISYAESGYIYMGEHESGSILRLNLTTGEETVLSSGSSPLNGAGSYTHSDIVMIDMSNIDSYTALASNGDGTFELLITEGGVTTAVSALRYSAAAIGVMFLFRWLFYTLAVGVVVLVLAGLVSVIRRGSTIARRLYSITIPLIIMALGMFSVIAYNYYQTSIQNNFEKQVMDEGNMLTALFGQESFDEIQYPYDYTGEAYDYLFGQLQTRDLYSRAVFYEDGELYVVVDEDLPCYYPVGILANAELEELYELAAVSGREMTGRIQDARGERLVCITPVGGAQGQVVYLLETGVYTANIDAYMQQYIWNFGIICISFLVILMILLGIAYYQVLLPIGSIREIMEEYAAGEKEIRINNTSEDELAGIARVFNQMAEDSEVREHTIEKLKTTYYRFVPGRMIELLGKDNLSDLTLGSSVRGEYTILQASLTMPEGLDMQSQERSVNRFFCMVDECAAQYQVMPIADSSHLTGVKMLCMEGLQTAVLLALGILARCDADNASAAAEEQLTIRFFIDKSEVYFTICGSPERYQPVLFTPELDHLLADRTQSEILGSRLLVTERSFEKEEELESFAHRYIGVLGQQEVPIGIWDIYDDRTAAQIKRMNQTLGTFRKAMKLYEKGYYYEAKNLFTMVLHENQEDEIAKQYIFLCDTLQQE